MTHDRARNSSINSLRAIAALAVLSNHVLGQFTPFVQPGLFGVILFFLISGYVIAWSLENLGTRPVPTFLIRRVFRLYPAYWVSVVFASLVTADVITRKQFLGNLTMIQEVFHIGDIVGVYWTLLVEIIFYTIVSFLLVFGVAQRKLTYAAGLVGFSVLSVSAALIWRVLGIHVPWGHALYLSVFSLGGFVSFVHRRDHRMQIMWPIAAVYLVVVAAIAFLIYGGGAISSNYRPFDYWTDYAVPLALFLLTLSRGWMAWAWLAYLGDLSYCTYLFHSPIHGYFRPRVESTAVLYLIVLSLTLAASVVIRHAVELPCIDIGRRLSKRLNVKPAVPEPTVEPAVGSAT